MPWVVFRCSFTVIVLTALVVASTSWYRLEKFLSFWFSWSALFNSDLTMAISVAWALIWFCCLQEMWDKCCSSEASQTNFLLIYSHRCGMDCLCALTLAAKHHHQMTPKLSETLWVRGSQTLFSGHHSEVGVSQIVGKLMFQGLIHLPLKSGFCATFFSPALGTHQQMCPWSPWCFETGFKNPQSGNWQSHKIETWGSDDLSVPERTVHSWGSSPDNIQPWVEHTWRYNLSPAR